MKAESGSPIIIFTNTHLDMPQDCACAISTVSMDRVMTKDFIKSSSRLSISKNLYQTSLTEEFKLLFNTAEQSGVVVINRITERIISGVHQGHTLAEISSQIGTPLEEIEAAVTQLLDKRILKQDNISPSPLMANSRELVVWLQLTDYCNLDCVYCFVSKKPEKMTVDVGKQSIDAAFRSAIMHGFNKVKIKFSGGEPTLTFNVLSELATYAREVGKKLSIDTDLVLMTNGVICNQTLLELIAYTNLRVAISLDGIERINDTQRPFKNGVGSFKLVWENIQTFLRHSIIPTISITLTPQSLEGLPDFVSLLLDEKVPFNINFFRPPITAKKHTSFSIDVEKIITGMRKVYKRIENNLPEYSVLNALIDRVNLLFPHTRPCGFGENYLVIDTHGKISKCHMELEKKVGDIQVGDSLYWVKDSFDQPLSLSLSCAECEWQLFCAGGCPILNEALEIKKSPYCEVYTTLIPEILQMEGKRLLSDYKNSFISKQ